MRKKISVYLLLIISFLYIASPLSVHAEEFASIEQITAVWDGNISTSWYDVYNEYKTLDSQTRYEADKVIATNAYRFLLSIGSKPLQTITGQNYDDFLRAVSPFNLAYNSVVAEQVVHAAWAISSDEYKLFCANVIHNLANNSDYFNTHVIKNDPFVNKAAQGSLQLQYNDIDLNEELNIYNNLFLNNSLVTSGSALNYFFNPNPLKYSGINISLNDLLLFKSSLSSSYRFSVYTIPIFYGDLSYRYSSSDLYFYYSDPYFSSGNYVTLYCDVVNNNCSLVFSSYSDYFGSFDLRNSSNPSFYFSDRSRNYINFPSFPYVSDQDIITKCYDYFDSYLSDFTVYSEGICLRINHSYSDPLFYILPFFGSYSFVSPQFKPVNIYTNNYYGSDDDTYWHVDTMADNIINNDYSNVDNGTNNSFYIENYYITQPVSNGAIELVTSSSITYNYITIINNNGNASGGSIGSYPYPFDVRIINPEDIKNETDINVKNDILNNYDIDFGDLNINSGLSLALDSANDSFTVVKDNPAFLFIGGFLQCIPSDLLGLFIGLGALILIITVYNLVTHKGGSG